MKQVLFLFPVSLFLYTATISNLIAENKISSIQLDSLKIGGKAPLFANQISPEGDTIQITGFKGKYLLIDFWASWCAPCRAENSTNIRIYNKYKSNQFEILGISLDRKKEEWLKAIQQDKLPWKQASDLQFWNNECVQLYKLHSLPFNVLIDSESKIIAIDIHGEDLEKKLKELIK